MRQKMIKAAAGILAAAMMLSVGTASAFAAGAGRGRTSDSADRRGICGYEDGVCRHIDNNANGVCGGCSRNTDSLKGCGGHFIDENGDGVCDYADSACRHTDSDHDGVCDNSGAKYGRNFCGGRNQ